MLFSYEWTFITASALSVAAIGWIKKYDDIEFKINIKL